ncbi:uncharacterized protein EV422DRAFT_495037 [Fimicolochytrium jonesii]|uniref:uncharacterized protein n=1 Tax=Fimicolochytrium jonesii TaxID=1396493 RepID=UPI0022FE892C|nr:uncharacterized protein EV422DRAFT_495037 [Fimicolochytrium jonesii]KAI8822072.1 hypothetical protein EV422DRAFT_495037 [Fimicolochytrium jonesii]
MASVKDNTLLHRPRPYQLELYQQARQRNIVAYLDTGSGKTLVSPKKVVFLVPTVPLVAQQAAKIRENTDFVVGEYSREDIVSVAYWDIRGWYYELSQRQVLVFTPQIFLNILTHGFLKLSRDVSLLIIDECHHAVKQHPYNLMMREFYHSIPSNAERPKVFGMTASPIYQKTITRDESKFRLQELESNLDCKVVTVTDRSSLGDFIPRASETVVEYLESADRDFTYANPVNALEEVMQNPSLSQSTRCYHFWMARLTEEIQNSRDDDAADAADRLVRSQDQIRSMKIELGPWLAGKAAQEQIRALSHRRRGQANPKAPTKASHGSDVLAAGNETSKWRNACAEMPSLSEITQNDITPKVHTLLRLLEERAQNATEGASFRAMIFVERRLSAKVLSEFLNLVATTRFPVVKCAFVTGHGASKSGKTAGRSAMNVTYQKRTFDRFRKGDMNTLVVTRVAEEGLDIPACKLIIVFDIFRSHTGYVQSRGRARDLDGSEYLIMVQRNDMHALRTVARAKVAEVMTQDIAQELSGQASQRQIVAGEITKTDIDDNTTELLLGAFETPLRSKAGAIISASGATTLLHRYCALGSLQRKELAAFYSLEFDHQTGTDNTTDGPKSPYGYAYAFRFPASTPLSNEVVYGPIRGTKKLAQQSVALAACKRLYDVGALNEHLLPNLQFKKKPGAFSLPALLQKLADEEFGDLYVWMVLLSRMMALAPNASAGSTVENNELRVAAGTEGYDRLGTVSVQEQGAASVLDDDDKVCGLKRKRVDGEEWAISKRQAVEKASAFDVLFTQLQSLASNSVGIENETFDQRPEILEKITTILKELVIHTPHSNVKYTIEGINLDMHPTAKFDKQKLGNTVTFLDYVTKQGYTVRHPDTSGMIEARHAPNVHNLLRPSKRITHGLPPKETAPSTHKVFLVPEACKVLPFPRDIYRMADIFPSILHKLDVYCTIDEFRKNIGLPVTNETLLAAFSSPSAQEMSNYERLETLGDSFLKYAVSMDLFKRFADADEGFLSTRRSRIVSNRNLFKIALKHRLFAVMNVTPFNPRSWDGHPFASAKGPWWRQISQKMLADFLEALIGAYYTDSGNDVALMFLHRFGLVSDATKASPEGRQPSLSQYRTETMDSLKAVEQNLKYRFNNRSLLMQALTHGSAVGAGSSGSYQRLEYLGDAVLDWVLTRFFFNSYPHLSPSALTDLRQAAVNNESFSRMAALLELHKSLRHDAPGLHEEIATYVKYLGSLDKSAHPIETAMGGPKVLGDLFEAVAGAVFIDSGCNLEVMWTVFKPLMIDFLEIHANPDVVTKSPIRQLQEFFQRRGFAVNDVTYRYESRLGSTIA